MKTIKSKLILTYSFISFAVICLIAIFFTLSMEKQFEQYAKKQQEQKISAVVEQIKKLYNKETGSYSLDQIEIVGNMALQNGLLVRIWTWDGEVDWDIQTHRQEECQLVIQHAENNMLSRYVNFQGKYQENKYDLIFDDNYIGNLTIGYYGPYSYSDGELQLLNNLSKYFVLIGVLFVIVAIILGGIMSRKITAPISVVIEVAQKISDGEFGAQARMTSKTAETQQLIEAINKMSGELEKEEAQKRQITADVAHELRTPLTNLQGQLEAMLDGIWEPTEERLESCREEILRLTNIVKQLQELYVLENKRDILKYEEFDFFSLCKHLYLSFDERMGRKKIRLLLRTKTGDMVWGDSQRIMQCMVNLVSNAVQYADPETEIFITYLENDKKSIKLQVQNRGKGIPKEYLPNLFERFYRVDKSRSTKTGGVGIGLSITKAIVERHGGMIWAECENGRETIFSIVLPKKD